MNGIPKNFWGNPSSFLKREGFKDLLIYAFLALWVVLKFWSFLLAPERFYWAGDFIESTHMRAHFYRCLKDGLLYLWNSRIGGGMPYLGTEFGTFYPLDFFQGLLFSDYFSPGRMAWVHALHFWMGGVFTFLYARQLGLYRIPALVSAVSFMLGGTLLGHAGHRNIVQGFVWLPLILYFLDQALERRKAFRAAVAGCLLAVSFFASHTQFFYFILLFIGLYFLFRVYLRVRERAWTTLRGDILYFVMAAFFCLSLSAVQLLPMLAVSLNTFHGTQPFDWQALFHFPPLNLIHYLIPDYMRFAATDFGEQYGYIGVLPLLLAIWAIVQCKDRRVRFFALTILFAFIASLGRLTPLYKFLFDFLPGLSQFRIPARFNALIIFPLTVLAGFGVQFLLEKIERGHAGRLGIGMVGILFLGLAAGVGIFLYLFFILLPPLAAEGHFASPWIELRKGFFWFLAVWAGSFLAVMGLIRCRAVFLTRLALVLAIGLDVLLLGRIDGGYVKEDPSRTPVQTQKDFHELLKDPRPFRVNNFPGLMNLLYSSREGIAVYDVENLLGYVGTVVPREYLDLYILAEKNPMLLDLLNVRYVSGRLPQIPKGLKHWEIGGGYDDKKILLKEIVPVATLRVTTFLSHAALIEQGKEVARIMLIGGDGSEIVLPLRAGIETAEWAVDRPGLTAKHRRATVAESWEMPGEGYQGHAYQWAWRFSRPLKVARIGMIYAHREGGLVIKKIELNQRELEDFLPDRFQEIRPGLYRNILGLPRAFTIARARAVSDEKEMLKGLEQLDPRETVLLYSLPKGYNPPATSGYSEKEAEIIRYSPEEVVLTTRTLEDKFLILCDTYSPYWQARIDGRSVEVLKVNYGLRGVFIPSGTHQVTFTFHFPPFSYGLVITLCGLSVFFVFVLHSALSSKGKQWGRQRK